VNKEDAFWFKGAVNNMLALHYKSHQDKEILRIWWEVLKQYPKEAVSLAFSDYARRGKFAPKPSDIREIIITNDGRPSSDEAWANVLEGADENNTVIWTDEIIEAWAVARPVWATNDRIGAKLAFREHYQNAVRKARDNDHSVSWTVHLGHDKHQREAVIKEALSQGIITDNKADFLSLTSSKPAKQKYNPEGISKIKQMLVTAAEADANKRALELVNKKKKEEERRLFLVRQATTSKPE